MTDPRRLFVRLTYVFEDLHALAVEGQAAAKDRDFLAVLTAEIGNGLQRCGATVAQINKLVAKS